VTDGPPTDTEVLDRVESPRGELVLRRVGDDLEIVSNGVFLMDTRDGRSERALVREAVAAHGRARHLLLGGLGVGFSLVEAAGLDDLTRIDVVEIEPVLVGWHRTHLAARTSDALADPRVRVVVADVADHLAAHPATYDVVCLDVDNGPDWTVTAANTALYGEAGLDRCLTALRPGGVLAVWSADAAPTYEALLRAHLDDVRVLTVEAYVDRGGPDVVYLGRRRA
jgi:spermidine synthase